MIVSLDKIEPSGFGRWATVLLYADMLRQLKKAPPVLLEKQDNKRYPFRVHDGAHRVEAAKLVRRTNIKAQIVAADLECRR